MWDYINCECVMDNGDRARTYQRNVVISARGRHSDWGFIRSRPIHRAAEDYRLKIGISKTDQSWIHLALNGLPHVKTIPR
jgi:hypothetical protein